MKSDERFTRRRFIGFSILMGLAFVILPRGDSFKPLKDASSSPLKRFLLRRSYPVTNASTKGKWLKDSLIVTVEDRAGGPFKLNRTSAFIFKQCNGRHTPSDIADMLTGLFDVDRERAKTDVLNTLEAFYNCGLIKA